MDIANVEAMEGYSAILGVTAAFSSNLAILLCFGQLGNYGNTKQLLTGESDCSCNSFLIPEFDIANAADTISDAIMLIEVTCPFDRPLTRSLTI